MPVQFTDAELVRLGGHLIRLYLEVERGLRRPQDLRRYVTPAVWTQLYVGPVERHPQAGLVKAADVGNVTMTRHGENAAYIAAAARVTHDRWTALSLELRVQADGRWKVAALNRVRQTNLRQALPTPADARPADLATRMHTVVSDLMASRKALEATKQRCPPLPRGKSNAATSPPRSDTLSSKMRPSAGGASFTASKSNSTRCKSAWTSAAPSTNASNRRHT